LESLKERDHLEDVGIYGRIILNVSYENRFHRCGVDSSSSGQGPMAGCCKHSNKPFGSMKGREFLD
jgi:hypothetical protein